MRKSVQKSAVSALLECRTLGAFYGAETREASYPAFSLPRVLENCFGAHSSEALRGTQFPIKSG